MAKIDKIGRRIPVRTKEWKKNISKALNKKLLFKCLFCKVKFWAHRYRKNEIKFCSRECKGFFFKGKERRNTQKKIVKYSGIHMWVRRYLRAIKCEECGKKRVMLHRANISGKYKRDLRDWKILCVPCHYKFDSKNKKVKNGK